MRKNIFITSITSLIFIVITLIGITHTPKIEHENEVAKLEPNEDFINQRTYPNKTFDVKAYQTAFNKAYQQNQINSLQKTSSTISWQLEGPGNIGGRFNCLEIDPTNNTIMYAGAACGGLWKTTNSGVNWIPVTDNLPYLAIGAIAINPLNANEIWIGTGDVNINGSMYVGDGIYKSLNGGATWNYLGLANTFVVSNIKFNAANPNEVLISTMGNPFNKDANRGMYKTTNSGLSFTNTLFVNDSTGVIDMVQHPTNPSILYASSFTRIRTEDRSTYIGTENYIYKSIDFGSTWMLLSGGLPNGLFNERIGISISKSNPNILYALYSTSDGITNPYLYKSTNAGLTWSLVNMVSFDHSAYNQGWYIGKIYIDPNNANTLYMPGTDLLYSTDGGLNWALRTPPWYYYEVHADGHYMSFNSSTDFVYCTDGGLYRTFDGGNNWVDIDNIPVNQFYSVTENTNYHGEYAGGVQDNGVVSGNAFVTNSFDRISGGDGFKVAFTSNPDLVYSESQNGNIIYNDLYTSGGSWVTLNKDPSQNYNWFTPYTVSSHDESVIFVGGEKVMRIDGAPYGSYTNISPTLYMPSSASRVQFISTVEQSKLDNQKIVAGTADGKVWNTLNYGVTWNDITPFTSSYYYVTSTMPSPNVSSNLYVTRSGYRYNDNTALVFKSINFGTSWSNISGDLPTLAVNDIEIMPGSENTIFVANDAGVYYTINGGINWLRLGDNMPFVPVFDIQLNYDKTRLIAGTYGRSMYTIDLSTLGTTLGIKQLSTENFSFTISPNPATDFIKIETSKKINGVKIYNINGKEVLNTTDTIINTTFLKTGAYIVAITIDNKLFTKKIIIE